MKRYRIFLNGRPLDFVDGHRAALLSRHFAMETYRSCCPDAVFAGSGGILDTPAVSQCCACSRYCSATISRVEARHG